MTRAEELYQKVWNGWYNYVHTHYTTHGNSDYSAITFANTLEGLEFDVMSRAIELYDEKYTAKKKKLSDWSFRDAVKEAAQEVARTKLDKVLE